MDRRQQPDDLSLPGWRWRPWSCGRLLTGLLWLCAFGSGAQAEPRDVSGAVGPVLAASPSRRPCPSLSSDEERVSAIYLDLDTALRVGGDPALRVGRQRWFCADSGVWAPSAGIDLVSTDPSALTLLLESESGEIWEIELARLDAAPLEPAAFASDRDEFFINAIEWTEDAELAVVDADFEVDLFGGDSVRGRVLWNAPWTPNEDAFVPLTDADRRNAWPGQVSIRGPELARLFRADGGVSLSSASADGQQHVAPSPSRWR